MMTSKPTTTSRLVTLGAIIVLAVVSCMGVQDERDKRAEGKQLTAQEEIYRQTKERAERATRERYTVLEIEEGKIYCIWGLSGSLVDNIPSCVFVPRKGTAE